MDRATHRTNDDAKGMPLSSGNNSDWKKMESRILHPYLATTLRRHGADIGDVVARTMGRAVVTRQDPRSHLRRGFNVSGIAMVPLDMNPMILWDDGEWINAIIDHPRMNHSLPIELKRGKAVIGRIDRRRFGEPELGSDEDLLGEMVGDFKRTSHYLVACGERHQARRNDAIVNNGMRDATPREVFDLLRAGYIVNDTRNVPGTLVDVFHDTVAGGGKTWMLFQESRERPMMHKAVMSIDGRFGYALASPGDVLETVFSDPTLSVITSEGRLDFTSIAHQGASL